MGQEVMSNNIALSVQNLSKRYRIGSIKQTHQSLGGALADFVSRPVKNFRRLRGLARFSSQGQDVDTIWALRDVSFEVKEGEVLGVVGRNAAGKSTLLKILARITDPSEGQVEIRGRVGSLLEVGTGFHPELTGRENVFLNGSILGMTKKEVQRKFDEIVDFSGVERFIDTPVKRYSTGMRVRLAFAVAAHVQPEILLVDEVLAVGDLEFQNKCLGKMSEVASGGRTVMFVSHNMGAVAALCTRALWIEQGRIECEGDPREVIGAYVASALGSQSSWVHTPGTCCGAGALFKSARVLAADGTPANTVPFDEPCKIEIAYQVVAGTSDLTIWFQLADSQGATLLCSFDTDDAKCNGQVRKPGSYVSVCTLPRSLLRPGRYILSFGSRSNKDLHSYHESVVSFNISNVGFRLDPRRSGPLAPLLNWSTDRVETTWVRDGI